jgi:serine/threonine protein kinase
MPSTDPESFAGTERFAVQRRLGAGSFGVVYEAFDRQRNTRVALKTLRVGTGRTLYRFKQEFRALTDVSHPNLVTLYELLAEGDQWFFTMEHIDGVTFLQHVRGSEGGTFSSGFSSPTTPALEALLRPRGSPGSSASTAGSSESTPDDEPEPPPDRVPDPRPALPPIPAGMSGAVFTDRLRAALAQLAEGVGALHSAGKLHRDIKPSNVLVTGAGRVVLLDFGLIRELRPDVTYTVETAGTPAYMSPEQAAERPLSESSDWYSVGVMLYEALTGNLPFTGATLQVLRRKQLDEPPPPSTVVPDVPEDLDVLCQGLLRRAPGQRPSGAEVLRRLRRDAVAAEVTSPPPLSAPSAGVPFVGRTGELARLHEAYAVLRSGRAITVTVHGGSGMGKTALVRSFLDEVRGQSPPPVILSGRCYERESVPYKAFDSVVDALSQHLRRLSPATVEALLPHDLSALVRLFPVLRQVRGVGTRRPPPEIPDSYERRRRAFAALRELFVRLADRYPVVVVMDDLHWGDVDSAALLTGLMEPPDAPAVLIIGCYRTEEATTSPLLSVLLPLRDLPAAAPLVKMDIPLGELGPEEARALARELLGHRPQATDRTEAIVREAQGNPFLVDALSRFSADETSGLAVDELIWRRVREMPEAARRLLAVVATAGRPIELGVAVQAAGLEGEGDAALAALRSVHFVRTRRSSAWEEVEPYHDRIRSAVTAGLPPDETRHVHERLATALLASRRADPERLAEHFREAGHLEEAADYAAAAADAAAEALAFERAARLYRLSLNLVAHPRPQDQRLRVLLGHALANAGRGRESAEAYLAAVAGVTDASERIDLQRRAAQQLLMAGHVEAGDRLVGTVLDAVGISRPRTTRQALVSLVLRRAFLFVRCFPRAWFREREEARVPARDLLRIDTCWSMAVGLGLIDMIRAAEFHARSLQLALRAGEPYRVARGLALEAVFVGVGGTRTRHRVDRLLGEANALASKLGHEHAHGVAAMADGICAWVQGRWKDARRLCDEATALLRGQRTGATWEADNAEMYALASLFMLGEVTELSRRLPRLLERAEDRGNLMMATSLRLGGFFAHIAWLAADDPDGARRELERGLAASTEGKFDFRHIWARGARRDIALYTGVGLEATAPIAEGWRRAARLLDRFPQAGLILGMFSRARRRLALAAAAADPDAVGPHLEQADRHARDMQRHRTRWGDALALLVRAGASSIRGHRERAIAEAAEAESRLEAADMALHAAAARHGRGEAIGGEAGRALVTEAEAWMTGQSIRRPDRMARMLAPGAWRRPS